MIFGIANINNNGINKRTAFNEEIKVVPIINPYKSRNIAYIPIGTNILFRNIFCFIGFIIAFPIVRIVTISIYSISRFNPGTGITGNRYKPDSLNKYPGALNKNQNIITQKWFLFGFAFINNMIRSQNTTSPMIFGTKYLETTHKTIILIN